MARLANRWLATALTGLIAGGITASGLLAEHGGGGGETGWWFGGDGGG